MPDLPKLRLLENCPNLSLLSRNANLGNGEWILWNFSTWPQFIKSPSRILKCDSAVSGYGVPPARSRIYGVARARPMIYLEFFIQT